VNWANYNRLERAWFIIWFIKLPKVFFLMVGTLIIYL